MFKAEATVEALRYNTDGFSISKFTIQGNRSEKPKERGEAINASFQNQVLNPVKIHLNGKTALDSGRYKEERLPIVTTYDDKEKLTITSVN